MRTTSSIVLGASALLSAFVPHVRAHGEIRSVSSPSGGSNDGPNIYYAQDAKNAKTVTRRMYPASGKAFALPSDYSNPSVMSCEGASGAPNHLDINAGEEVTIFWEGSTKELLGIGGLTAYNPFVHGMGPIFDYIADCNGDCSTFDASGASWVKLAQNGLDTSTQISDALKNALAAKPEPYYGGGRWAIAKLDEEYSTWKVQIPSTLKPGKYIVRNELVAVHSPKAPQHYIGCVQLNVKGSGTTSLPAGVKSNQLYDSSSILATYDVYSTPNKFTLPASPAVWNPSADSGSGSGATTTKAAETTTQAAPTTTKAAETTTQAAPTTTKAAGTTTQPAPTTTKAAASTSKASSAAPAPSTTKKCSAKKRAAKRAAKLAAEAAAKRTVREARAARAHRRASVH